MLGVTLSSIHLLAAHGALDTRGIPCPVYLTGEATERPKARVNGPERPSGVRGLGYVSERPSPIGSTPSLAVP